jgi:hypothetical protein
MVVPAPDLTQLIWLVSCQILLYALGWGLCSVLLREQRDSVAHWAGFMLLVGLGFALISQRGEPRTWGPYVWGNVLFLIGLVALHRGMERFVGTRPADREHLVTLAVGCAGFVWLGPAEDQGAMRVLLAYGSGAWVLSRALFKMLRGLRVEFGLRLTWLLATPPMVVAVLFIVRMSQQLIDLDRRFEMHFLDEGNRLLLYGYLVSAAMFNFAFIGLLTTRFVGRMRQQALHDPLTALPNRRALDNELQKAWQRLRREHRRFALLALDLDRFKAVNDVYGHLAGDSVLQQVKNSPYQSRLLRGFRIQWFSSGNHSSRAARRGPSACCSRPGPGRRARGSPARRGSPGWACCMWRQRRAGSASAPAPCRPSTRRPVPWRARLQASSANMPTQSKQPAWQT